jgi:DNA replication protein DnaC
MNKLRNFYQPKLTKRKGELYMFFSKDQYQEEIVKWENRLVKTCPICNGVGSVLSTDRRNKMCTCMEKALLNTGLVSCGIPRKYLNDNWTWESCIAQDFVTKCKHYAENFEENYFSGKGIYLYGSQGRGKSTMESLIAKEVAMKINPDTKKHYKVAFAIYEDIVQLSHQARINKDAARKLDVYVNTPDLLIIDNIGSETGLYSETKHTTRLLEFILRKRDNNGLSTLLSSNFTPEELAKNYSDTIHDFVIQNCELVLVTGSNFRKQSETSELLNELQDFNVGEWDNE